MKPSSTCVHLALERHLPATCIWRRVVLHFCRPVGGLQAQDLPLVCCRSAVCLFLQRERQLLLKQCGLIHTVKRVNVYVQYQRNHCEALHPRGIGGSVDTSTVVEPIAKRLPMSSTLVSRILHVHTSTRQHGGSRTLAKRRADAAGRAR